MDATTLARSRGSAGGGPNLASLSNTANSIEFALGALRNGETYNFRIIPDSGGSEAPLPATLPLLGIGLLGLCGLRRRR